MYKMLGNLPVIQTKNENFQEALKEKYSRISAEMLGTFLSTAVERKVIRHHGSILADFYIYWSCINKDCYQDSKDNHVHYDFQKPFIVHVFWEKSSQKNSNPAH